MSLLELILRLLLFRNNKLLDYTNKTPENVKLTPELLDDNIEEIRKIENKLDSMKEIDKKVFMDFYYSSKSIKDIAKENKISEFSIKQRLYRIRNNYF